MTRLTGKQRLRQIKVKIDIIARRERREYMAGQRDWLPCTGDRERAMICAEFDRVFEMGFAAGRARLREEDAGSPDIPERESERRGS